MKNFLIILLFFLSIKSTYAKCASGGFQFYPEQEEVSLNSMFIIQGYAKSQELILGFDNTNIFLESKNGELIKLILQELLKGQKGLTQAIFKPEKQLEPNTVYYLKHPDDSKEFFTRWNSDSRKREKVHWTTIDSETYEPIDSIIQIEFEKNQVKYYGCGPSVNAIFNTSSSSDIEIWYKTELYNITNKSSTIYFITESNGKLYIGHGMCAGAFAFDKSSNYKVRFTPVNIDGNETMTTEWFEFKNPYLNEE